MIFIITIIFFSNSSIIMGEEEPEWLLVALGDSNSRGFGVSVEDTYVSIYADYIEEDLGVKVKVSNWSTNISRDVADWTRIIRENKLIYNDLKKAKIITLWLGWDNIIPVVGKIYDIDLAELEKVTSSMEQEFANFFSELTKISDPKETLILIADIGIPPVFYYPWKENGTYEVLKYEAYEKWRNYLMEAADKYNVKVVETYKVLNGPEGNNIISEEYMLNDMIHLSEKGHKLIADLHREVGYSPLK